MSLLVHSSSPKTSPRLRIGTGKIVRVLFVRRVSKHSFLHTITVLYWNYLNFEKILAYFYPTKLHNTTLQYILLFYRRLLRLSIDVNNMLSACHPRHPIHPTSIKIAHLELVLHKSESKFIDIINLQKHFQERYFKLHTVISFFVLFCVKRWNLCLVLIKF